MNTLKVPSYPLRLLPEYRDYLWGGRNIVTTYQREGVPPGPCAESWEVFDRPEGSNIIQHGPWAGRDLKTYHRARYGVAPFPLLVKLIDAQQRLSVQVHPDDAAAARGLGEAKSELWYILQAKPGAHVWAGFQPGTDLDTFTEAIHSGNTAKMLRSIPVQAGDAIWIPGGRVHAIGEGCLLFEVQQNSDTTYRLDDWGRLGPDGRPRPLHIEQALQAICWQDRGDPLLDREEVRAQGANRVCLIARTPYFSMERWELRAPYQRQSEGEPYQIIFVEQGEALVNGSHGSSRMPHGSSWLIPPGFTSWTIHPMPEAILLHVRVAVV